MNDWIELHIPVDDEFREGMVNLLFELGTVGCQDTENSIISYFDLKIEVETVIYQIKYYLDSLLELGFNIQSNEVKVGRIENKDV